MIRPDDVTEELPRDDERALRAPEPPQLPAPLLAMAEALRANAEALRRLDSSQQRIAESIEKSERAQQVVASTRSLNDTFKGLSEIQRGLLDALVKKGGGGGGNHILLLLVAAVFSGVLCVLIYDSWSAKRTVPVERFEQSRAAGEALRRELEEAKSKLDDAAAAERDGQRKLGEKDEALAQAAKGGEEYAAKIQQLQQQLKEKEARLEAFLAVKEQADLAGALQIQNAGLEREIRDLKERIVGFERQRTATLEAFGEKLMEMGRDVDPEQLKAVARSLGVYEDPPPRAPPGTFTLSRSAERLLVGQVNRLLPDSLESYDLVKVGALEGGLKLLDVTLTRNRNRLLVNTLSCKEMVIHVDPEKDTVELRLKDGVISNPARPGEQIPIGDDGHSIFLEGVGLKEWLRREGDRVAVDPRGLVTWPGETYGPRSPPSSGSGGSKESPEDR